MRLPQQDLNRRQFVTQCGATMAAMSIATPTYAALEDAASEDHGAEGWLKHTLKATMIRVPSAGDDIDGWVKKFAAAKAAGFVGVEPNTSKHVDADVMNAAAKKTGLTIDGTVGGYHWKTRHTDPDPNVRTEAQELLERGLKLSSAMGCESMLLVPGHGKDGTPDEVKARATQAVEQAIPLAANLKVQILIENVWNHFLYDHDGGSDQSVQPLADWIDSFGSEWVGVQYDLGNHWKYGDVAEWVTTLGPRIKKLDIKGFSREQDKFTDIGDGDVNWPSVRRALAGIGFTGWLAAEVGGGDQQRLETISRQMREVLWTEKSVAEARA